MGKIVWLASYPKSGNTWVRLLLANYLSNSDGPLPLNDIGRFVAGDTRAGFFEAVAPGVAIATMPPHVIARLRPQVHHFLAGQASHRALIKTHSANAPAMGTHQISRNNTERAIYIVRNPMDIAVSLAHHSGLSIDNAIAVMGTPRACTATAGRTVGEFLGSWSENVLSWLQTNDFPVLVVRYESLIADTRANFLRICRFLDLPPDPWRVEKALRHSRFDAVATQEADGGFVEKPPTAERFFRQGKAGAGLEVLTEAQRARIVADHGKVMSALGYLAEKPAGEERRTWHRDETMRNRRKPTPLEPPSGRGPGHFTHRREPGSAAGPQMPGALPGNPACPPKKGSRARAGHRAGRCNAGR